MTANDNVIKQKRVVWKQCMSKSICNLL